MALRHISLRKVFFMYLPKGWTARPEQLRVYKNILEEFEKDGIHFVEWGDDKLKYILDLK